MITRETWELRSSFTRGSLEGPTIGYILIFCLAGVLVVVQMSINDLCLADQPWRISLLLSAMCLYYILCLFPSC